MINLLPPQQKKELLEEERYRLFSILGVLILILLIALSLVFFSIKTYISGKTQSGKILIPSQLQDQEKEIMGINRSLQKLSSFYKDQSDFAELLGRFPGILSPGIHLTSFSLTSAEKKGNFQVALQGLSLTRELLFQLKKNLESESSFKDVNFPPSNWVKAENIEFSANFKVEL